MDKENQLKKYSGGIRWRRERGGSSVESVQTGSEEAQAGKGNRKCVDDAAARRSMAGQMRSGGEGESANLFWGEEVCKESCYYKRPSLGGRDTPGSSGKEKTGGQL